MGGWGKICFPPIPRVGRPVCEGGCGGCGAGGVPGVCGGVGGLRDSLFSCRSRLEEEAGD